MTTYEGNTLLTGLAELTGMPLDHINFIFAQTVALLIAPLMQSVLHPSLVKSSVRHIFVSVVGLCLGCFAFGVAQALHLAVLPTLCYVLLKTLNPQVVQRWVMVVALGYLSLIHLHRTIYDTGVYALDVTGPLMVMTQKITSLAFSVHDGLGRSASELRPNQKYHAIRKIPSILEYYGFLFHFSTLMAGPMVFFNDYMDFITGQNFLKHSPSTAQSKSTEKRVVTEPRPFYPAMKKVCVSMLCAAIFTFVVFPLERVKDDDFLKSGIVYQTAYLYISTALIRLKYYHAWVFAEAINNVSGLGFNGFLPNGEQNWDLLTNVDILGFEFGGSMRECISSWNIGTNKWLRFVVYERVPSSQGVPLTFALSALWHGFFPGYYITFASGALFTLSSRIVRKYVRPHFLDSSAKKNLYDLLTIFVTRILMSYIAFPFALLNFTIVMRIYWNMYFWLHIVGVLSIVVLPRLSFLSCSENQLRNRINKLVASSNGVNGLHG